MRLQIQGTSLERTTIVTGDDGLHRPHLLAICTVVSLPYHPNRESPRSVSSRTTHHRPRFSPISPRSTTIAEEETNSFMFVIDVYSSTALKLSTLKVIEVCDIREERATGCICGPPRTYAPRGPLVTLLPENHVSVKRGTAHVTVSRMTSTRYRVSSRALHGRNRWTVGVGN
jgi:hypothetical protein